MWASGNCNAVKKCSLFSVWILTVRPRAGGLWAYSFAVIHFCKNFFPRGAQAGADERGFRDVAPSVALSAGLDAVWGYVCSELGCGTSE